MVKVGVNHVLHFSNFFLDRLTKATSELSVRGELCRASHRKEEEDEGRKSEGRLLRRKPVLSRSNGLTSKPTKDQMKRINKIPDMMCAHHTLFDRKKRHNGGKKTKKMKKIKTPIGPKYDISRDKVLLCNISNCFQVEAFSNGTSSTIT